MRCAERENERGARYCRSCGAAFAAAPAAEEARKVVTVVFSDLADSTAIGHALDPESLRQLMGRYYDEMRAVLERHGAQVEKFIGDAVMAVFGVPVAHEDDALRAVRSAVEMRAVLEDLNGEFLRQWGVTMSARTGVHTGEVVAGGRTGERSFLVGDAVNVAARLEQAAGPGEILVSRETHRLVFRAAVTEEAGDVVLKGKPEPVPAYRLLEVVPGAAGWTRRLDSPLVGRERELALLETVFSRVDGASSSAIVTVVGVAGVGKSRLTVEFLSRLRGRATVVEGRCLPYGEGITFWPVAEVLRDAAGVSDRDSSDAARSKIRRLLAEDRDGELISARLAPLLGAAGSAATIQETFWGVRRLFEHLAAERPLVVVFDDIQWGESTFLDLLEYAADWMRAAPVLILCQARPELFEVRPGWAMAKSNATLIPLEGLTEVETTTLIENLVGPAESVSDARARLGEMAEGNPLFVEEMLRMLVDDGLLRRNDDGWAVEGDLAAVTIPPTIQALLTARLDRLDEQERVVIERASVVGRVFWWGAVSELCPPELAPGLIHQLQSLARKELIRPDHSETSGEDSFRFAHILIRDVAYQGIPKADRASLHERFADWVAAEAAGRAGEYEEVVGYHLEAAHAALLELGLANERTAALGRRASESLASVGKRAFARGDMPAAVNLLERATALLDERDPARIDLMLELAFALLEVGDFAHLQTVLSEMIEVVPESDVGRSTHVAILRLWMRMSTDPQLWVDEARTLAADAISAFREVGDERGLAPRLVAARPGAHHERPVRAGRARVEEGGRARAPGGRPPGGAGEPGLGADHDLRRPRAHRRRPAPVRAGAGVGGRGQQGDGGRMHRAGDVPGRPGQVRRVPHADGTGEVAAGRAGADGVAGRPGRPVRRVDRAARGRSGWGRAGAPLRPRHPARDRRGGLALDGGGDPGRGRVPAGPRRRGRSPDPRERAVGRRRGRLLAGHVAQCAGQGAGTPQRSSHGDASGGGGHRHRGRFGLPPPSLARADEPCRGAVDGGRVRRARFHPGRGGPRRRPEGQPGRRRAGVPAARLCADRAAQKIPLTVRRTDPNGWCATASAVATLCPRL